MKVENPATDRKARREIRARPISTWRPPCLLTSANGSAHVAALGQGYFPGLLSGAEVGQQLGTWRRPFRCHRDSATRAPYRLASQADNGSNRLGSALSR